MTITTENVKDLVEAARREQREQDRVETQIEGKKGELADEIAALVENHGISPAELPEAIEAAQSELVALAVEAGLGEMLPDGAVDALPQSKEPEPTEPDDPEDKQPEPESDDCKACGGTGKSSNKKKCVPCGGTGKKQPKPEPPEDDSDLDENPFEDQDEAQDRMDTDMRAAMGRDNGDGREELDVEESLDDLLAGL